MERGFGTEGDSSFTLLGDEGGSTSDRRARQTFRIGSAAAALLGVLAIAGLVSAQNKNQAPAAVVQLAAAASQVATVAAAKDQPSAVTFGRAVPQATAPADAPVAESMTDAVSLSSKVAAPVFDAAGRFIMRAYDKFKPMASFLPGVGGVWGVPMWAFYVNRGQAIATFGVENKDSGILLFSTADKAYQSTPFLGFRTLLKGKTASGKGFESQPFFPESDAKAAKPARRDMYIGNNELEIEESDPVTGIRTNVLYLTAPNEDFPALVRRVTFTNEGSEALELDAVDGLAKLEPTGGLDKLPPDKQINAIGRTLEGWMHVYNFDKNDMSTPFYHFVTAPADTADVALIKEGHFAVAMIEEDANVGSDGAHAQLPMICDQQLLFGTDTTLTVPRRFFSSASSPDGESLANILKTPQSTTSRTPSAFAAASLKLQPGESKTISVVYGHSPDLETLTSKILPKLKAKGYISGKVAEARALGTSLTERVAMSSAVPQLDQYAKQNYLDNLLRGGMPMQIGDAPAPDTKIYHAFSRIHGDLERDYNNFVIEPSYWSQGPGNFRDVNQNRRCDALQLPAVHDFNVRQFLSYVQHDGYSQLTVATALFKIRDAAIVDAVSAKIATAADVAAVHKLLSAPFRPGQLFNDLRKGGVALTMGREEVLELVTAHAEQVPAGQYPQTQNGFWTDHFTYHLDLVHNFLAVYPEEKESMLYDSAPIPFYLSPGACVPRSAKNMLAPGDKVRQFDAVLNSTAKIAQLSKIYADPQYVGDAGGGADWQRTASGEVMKVSIIAKLVVLATNKFAIMDYLGMGVEMEAGKPGWNDAMNGLPALFGSEMPSAYELHEIVAFAGGAIDEIGRSVELPEELGVLLTEIERQLKRLGGSTTDADNFAYWDAVHDALEVYRAATDATFSGTLVSWSPAKLGTESGILGAMLRRMDAGIARALTFAIDGVSPTYFKFTVTSYEPTGVMSKRGLPNVKVQGFEAGVLPLFLEGPTRQMKTIKSKADARAVYEAVLKSDLRDKKLDMFKVSASLADQPFEIGRMKAFDAGWLENESVWLHMSYKWYLELLRAGLYAEFFKEIQTGVVSFMDPEVLGRSPLEAASFIVSSAFPDTSLHGSGFLARLSGSTAEFLSMWNHMTAGAAPFSVEPSSKALQLALAPVIASWLWRKDGTLVFKFLGAITVTYICPSKKNSWEATVTSYTLEGPSGKLTVKGAVVPSPAAEDVRALKYTAITVTLE